MSQKSKELGQALGKPTVKSQGEKEKPPKKEEKHKVQEEPEQLSVMETEGAGPNGRSHH